MVEISKFDAMIQNDIDSLSMQELCDLLSKTTMELLDIIGQKGTHSSAIIRDKDLEVKSIQLAITQKKSREKHMA